MDDTLNELLDDSNLLSQVDAYTMSQLMQSQMMQAPITASPYVTVSGINTCSNTVSGIVTTDILKEAVDKAIQENLGQILTKVPTDIGLGDTDLLVVKVEVGDMPKEHVVDMLRQLSRMFEEKGLTKVIIYPSSHGIGDLDFSRIDIGDKLIE